MGRNYYYCPILRCRCGPYKANGTSIEYIKRHVPLFGDALCLNRGVLVHFFEGETPLQKMDPQKWRSYERHSMNPVNFKLHSKCVLLCNCFTLKYSHTILHLAGPSSIRTWIKICRKKLKNCSTPNRA